MQTLHPVILAALILAAPSTAGAAPAPRAETPATPPGRVAGPLADPLPYVPAHLTQQTAEGGWRNLSDRANKENIVPVNALEVLDQLAGVPISTWNYRTQPPTVRHIGPMAQDFAAAFKVGEDNRHINSVDSEGVALAAIQGLALRLKEKDAQIAALQERVTSLERTR